MITRRTALLGAASGLLLGACSNVRTDQVIREGHLELRLSKQWRETGAPGAAPWTRRFVLGSSADLQAPAMQIAGRFSEDVGSYAALARLDLPATLSLADYEPTDTRDTTIKNAYDAVLRRYTWTESVGSQTQTWQGAWIVASQWPYPATAAISIGVPVIDDAVLDELITSTTFIVIESD